MIGPQFDDPANLGSGEWACGGSSYESDRVLVGRLRPRGSMDATSLRWQQVTPSQHSWAGALDALRSLLPDADPFRAWVGGFVSVVARLLNVDGFGVLAVDATAQEARLDEGLLRSQFLGSEQ